MGYRALETDGMMRSQLPTWLIDDDMAIIAHRGGASLGQENSTEVLGLARDAGAAAVEADVQELADGSLVMLHDGYVLVGDAWHWVRELSRAELSTLTDRTVTTLDAFLDAITASGLGLYLELKAVSPDGVIRAIDAVMRAGLEDLTIIGSFRADIVARVGEDGRLPASILYRDPWTDPLALANDLGCHVVHPCYDNDPWVIDLMIGPWMERLTRAGIAVVGWNVNDRALLERMRACRLNAACTDDPRIAFSH